MVDLNSVTKLSMGSTTLIRVVKSRHHQKDSQKDFFHDYNVTTKIKASVINSVSHLSLKFLYKDVSISAASGTFTD